MENNRQIRKWVELLGKMSYLITFHAWLRINFSNYTKQKDENLIGILH